jgi:cell division protein FtsX
MTQGKWFTVDQIADALRKSRGIAADAATFLSVSRRTIANYIERYPELREVQHEAREQLADLAERSLNRLVEQDDGPTIRWVLAKLRSQVFGDTMNLQIKGETKHIVQLEAVNNDRERLSDIVRILEETDLISLGIEPQETGEAGHS